MAERLTGYLIDTPVSALSTEAEVRAWIDELEKLPQDDPGVQSSLREANFILELITKSK